MSAGDRAPALPETMTAMLLLLLLRHRSFIPDDRRLAASLHRYKAKRAMLWQSRPP